MAKRPARRNREVVVHPAAQRDGQHRKGWKDLPHASIDFSEHRDHVQEKHGHHHRGHGDDGGGIDHGGLDLALEPCGPLDEQRQAGEDLGQDAAVLAGRHHADEQRVEQPGVPGHGVGQGHAVGHVEADPLKRLSHHPVLGLIGEHLKTLDDGHAGLDHHGEVPRQHDNIVGADPGRESRDGDLPPQSRALLPDARRQRLDPPPAKLGHHGAGVRRLQLTSKEPSLAVPAFPPVERHEITPSQAPAGSGSVTRSASSMVVTPSRTFRTAAWRRVRMPVFMAADLSSPAEPPRSIILRRSSVRGITS